MLKIKNKHPRDDNIQFDEPTHKYTVDGDSSFTSVTTFIHKFFPKFDPDIVISKMKASRGWDQSKYYGMSDIQIKTGWDDTGKEASSLGTLMHLNIENYYNNLPFTPGFTETKEYRLFMQYLSDHSHLQPFRTEWCVYSKAHKIAGSIDMLYLDPMRGSVPADAGFARKPKGFSAHEKPQQVIIADWKRSKEIKFDNKWENGYPPLDDISNCNYWHYTLQLNLYRMILEKYYNLQVTEMFLVILHPNQDQYQKITIPRVWKPIIAMLKLRET